MTTRQWVLPGGTDTESARRVVELRVAPLVEQRVEVLAGRANEGRLSDEERAEYEAFINAATRDLVRRRADNRYEYCLLRQEYSELTHHVEHIVSKQHGGSDDADNLALLVTDVISARGQT